MGSVAYKQVRCVLSCCGAVWQADERVREAMEVHQMREQSLTQDLDMLR